MIYNILHYQFKEHTVQEWCIALLFVACAFAFGRLLLWFNRKVMRKRTLKTASKYDDILLATIEIPLMFAIVLGGLWLGANALHLSDTVMLQINTACRVLLILDVAWFVAKITNASLAEYVDNNSAKNNGKMDKLFIHSLRQVLYVFIWLIAALTVLQTVGVNIRTLLTTLGIGGVAVALAAQDTLKNIIGGVTLLIDRPFKLGDRVQTNGFDGIVESIGLRSTRLRTMENRLVTIPNNKMVDVAIENVSREPSRKVALKLGLTYQTAPDKMQEALAILGNIPQQVQHIAHNTLAAFSGYGDFALEITFIYYIKKRQEIEVLEVVSNVNIAILKALNQARLNFAYPTQTVIMNSE
jgi:MscS family membrane protein